MPEISATTNAPGQPAQGQNSPPPTGKAVINGCLPIISAGVTELLSRFFAQLDDALFKLSDTAESNAKQTQMFETMRFFRRKREEMEKQYLQNLSIKYNDYWTAAAKPQQASDAAAEEESLSLLDEALFEERLAINGIIEKGNALHQEQLYPLNQRFCFLSNKESEADSLPVSPAVLCKQFSKVLEPMKIELKIKLLIYKLFDCHVLSKMGGLYQNLNAHLVAKGVLPVIPVKIALKKASAQADSESVTPQTKPAAKQAAQPPSVAELADLSVYLEAFRSMQSLMDNRRLQLGLPAPLSASMPGAIAANSTDIVNVIDLLQRTAFDGTDGQPATAESLKHNVAIHLSKVQGNQLGRTIGRPEEDVIDMVGIIFDFILDDKNVAALVKGLIARLQIPIIKVAIIDKTFFAKKNHAARLLLNDLAQAGIGINDADAGAGADNLIIQKIEEIVSKVLKDFSQNVALFEELLKDFSEFMAKDAKRSTAAESRILQTTQSKEKVWLAKKAVAGEITQRLENKNTPATFRTFVYNDWKDVLFLAYLRRDKEDGEWERALETLDKLIWSITPPNNAQERTKLIRELPAVIKAVKDGLHSTSIDAHQIKALLKELEVCHMDALHPDALRRAAEQSAQAQATGAVMAHADIDIKDAELADAILEVKTHLPDIDDIDINEVTDGKIPGISPQEASGWLKNFVKDQHWETANRLKVGDWVEFINEDSKLGRAKLARPQRCSPTTTRAQADPQPRRPEEASM
ncbi:MAG: DUF1631 domain-containing protein [Candidatus Methylumidiphilus sp.]